MRSGRSAAGRKTGGPEGFEADLKIFLMFLKKWHASCYIISANRGKKLKNKEIIL